MGCGFSKENDRNAAGLVGGHLADHTGEVFTAAEMVTGGGVTSRIELSLSAQGLKDKDINSKSDPFCVVYMRSATAKEWTEVGRTEIIANHLNPDWVTRIMIYYHFEEIQHIKFAVYDCDTSFNSSETKNLDLSKQDFLGEAETPVAPIVKTSGYWQGPLIRKSGNARGNITVHTEEVANANGLITMQLRCSKLENQAGLLGTSNAFIKLSKLREDGQYAAFFRTEVKMNNLNPAFNEIKGSVVQIANGDMYRPLKVEVYDWRKSGTHVLIGEAEVSLNQLQEMATSRDALPIMHPDKRSKSGYVNGGLLNCDVFNFQLQPSFVEYVKGGTEVSFMVAIDFTASNIEANMPSSLHYIHPSGQQLNQYATSITSVGSVLEFYDHDKMFPLYGFGGKPVRGGPAEHCFPLNGNEGNAEVCGVNGILQTYYDSLKRVQLSGPTLFSSIIGQASAIAESTPQSQSHQKYYVLMIITDGVINDMDSTIECIVRASGLPLSIVIVGVGDADFTDMERLDGDKVALQTRNGVKQQRDIVQFVPMKEYRNLHGEAYRSAVARSVLEEIPKQVTDFYKHAGIQPTHHVKPPPPPPYSA
jgi:hypothetical protein